MISVKLEDKEILHFYEKAARLPYWNQDMDFDIETWVPYGCDFKPVTTNSLFSDALGSIARMALQMGSEFLYLEANGACPVGTLVPENLIHPHFCDNALPNFAMVFAYSHAMEQILYTLSRKDESLGAGIALCGIWKRAILLDECKVLIIATKSPFFDVDAFLLDLENTLRLENGSARANVPYFAERFGYRRFSIPYETDNMTELYIARILDDFEFDESRSATGGEGLVGGGGFFDSL